MTSAEAVDTVVLDVDGTLVDTNYLHVVAWDVAFSAVGLQVPHWRIHRAIGIGGDRLVTEVAGQSVEDAMGDDVRARHDKEFAQSIAHAHPLPGAAELLAELSRRQLNIVVATSGPPDQSDRLLELVDAGKYLHERATSADADRSKPAPDVIDAALDRVGGSSALVVGDSVWDVRAAKQRGHVMFGVLTGGISEAELRGAGADEVFVSAEDLLVRVDDTPVLGG